MEVIWRKSAAPDTVPRKPVLEALAVKVAIPSVIDRIEASSSPLVVNWPCATVCEAQAISRSSHSKSSSAANGTPSGTFTTACVSVDLIDSSESDFCGALWSEKTFESATFAACSAMDCLFSCCASKVPRDEMGVCCCSTVICCDKSLASSVSEYKA